MGARNECNLKVRPVVQYTMNYLAILLTLTILSCSRKGPQQESRTIDFYPPRPVLVAGYTGNDLMEPFLSRDGHWLFFNNLNDPSVNTNIFYAEKVNDTVFQYQGEVQGVNSTALDGVPTMDRSNNFYFVSTRSYAQSLSTIYHGVFDTGRVTGVALVPGISRTQPGIVNFDVEVSADGNTLYFTDGGFNAGGQLQSADLVVASSTGAGFQRLANSAQLLSAVNTSGLEYAACISDDELTLFFTRVASATSGAAPRIYYATRENKGAPFLGPHKLVQADGFTEAATVSGDSLVYYHKKEAVGFRLYCIRRK